MSSASGSVIVSAPVTTKKPASSNAPSSSSVIEPADVPVITAASSTSLTDIVIVSEYVLSPSSVVVTETL